MCKEEITYILSPCAMCGGVTPPVTCGTVHMLHSPCAQKRMLIPALISIQPAHQCHTSTVYVCTYVHIYNKVYVCYTQNKLECIHIA